VVNRLRPKIESVAEKEFLVYIIQKLLESQAHKAATMRAKARTGIATTSWAFST